MEEVHTARVGGLAEHVERGRIEITIHGRGDEAERGIAVAQVALQSADKVVRHRLDLIAMAQVGRRVRHGGPFACRERVQDSDRPAARPLAAQLRGAEDGTVRRDVGELSVSRNRPLRWLTDAPRVEVLRPIAQLGEPAAVSREPEDVAAFDEEGTLLLELHFEGCEVDERGVQVHLAEIGVYGGVEGEVRGHAVLEIGAHTSPVRAPTVEGIARGVRRVVVAAPDHIGQDFHALRRGEVFQPLEIGEARRDAALGLPHEREHVELVLALDPALEAHSPHLRRRAREPELGERNPHLDGPAERINRSRGLPHGVPRVVRIAPVVSQQNVPLHARGVDDELEGGATIVVAVQEHPKLVAVGRGVPSSQPADDGLRRGVEQAGPDVQRFGVVQDPHVHPLRGGRALLRVPLHQPADRSREGPGGVVQPPVEHGSGGRCDPRGGDACRYVRDAGRVDGL